jgi:hypothetical protein
MAESSTLAPRTNRLKTQYVPFVDGHRAFAPAGIRHLSKMANSSCNAANFSHAGGIPHRPDSAAAVSPCFYP